MKTLNIFKPVCLFILGLVLPASVYSQYLILADNTCLSYLDERTIQWFKVHDDVMFAAITELTGLDRAGVEYSILDDETVAGVYYWVESRYGNPIRLEYIAGARLSTVLWYDRYCALVRAETRAFLRSLPREYTFQQIFFHDLSNTQTLQKPVTIPSASQPSTSTIQAILDAVSIDSLYYTMEHLSGETPFRIAGELDSIMTRYSFSPDIFKAQDYIQSRLENMGYEVELQPFALSTRRWYDIQFAPDKSDTGWLASWGLIYGTDDGGQTWNLQYTSENASYLWSVFPVNNIVAFTVGDYGAILKTTNGGSQWQSQTSPTNAFLFGVFFINEETGWICGDGGIVLKTTNGGAAWTLKDTPSNSRLYDIFFSDASNGWTVGRDGTILHTTDSGETWTQQPSGTAARLYGVHFLNPEIGFVVGGVGGFLKTDNAGQTWTPVSVPINVTYYDVDFIDQNRGIMVSSNGNSLITTDGGANWNSISVSLNTRLYACDFVDASVVWVCGIGEVAKSEDSEANWQSQNDALGGNDANNVIATKTGTQYPDKYYIICAHYDDTSENPMTRAPGADDNASGTAAVIEAARVLSEHDLRYSIKFILFAAEEQGLLGSDFYASQASQSGEQIGGVINLDMIGYDGNDDGIFEIHSGKISDSQILGNFVASGIGEWDLNLTSEIITGQTGGGSDHSSFWRMGYPAILIIEDFQDFTPHYHTTNDRLSTLNPNYFLNLSRLSIGSLASLSEIDTADIPTGPIPTRFVLYDPYPNPFNSTVTIKYYLPSLNKVSIDVYDVLGRWVTQISNEFQDEGYHDMRWDGTAEFGNYCPSGLYFIRVQSDSQVFIKKVILMR